MILYHRIYQLVLFVPRALGWLMGWLYLNIMYSCMPESYRTMGLILGKDCGAHLTHKDPNDYIFTFRTFRALVGRLRWLAMDVRKSAFLGHPAPNPRVHGSCSQTAYALLDYNKEDRPLVLAFGSCTSPRFMERLDTLRTLVEEYRHTVDFVVVYCREAHARDAWGFENAPYPIDAHRTLQDRCLAAQTLRSELRDAPCRLVVDAMDNESCTSYGALPSRLYIINNGAVVLEGGRGPQGYKLEEVEHWLLQHQC